MSIQVAVRVRPFNERELKLNAKCCIEMVLLLTIIVGGIDSNKGYGHG